MLAPKWARALPVGPAAARLDLRDVRQDHWDNCGAICGAMRTFLAFPIPRGLINHVACLQDALRRHGVRAKWVRPESCHSTVLFLGEQESEDLERLCLKLAARLDNEPPLRLQCDGVNTFGSPARVVFVDLRDEMPRRFAGLVEQVADAVHDANVPLPGGVSKREPAAHLTLARFRGRHEAKTLERLGRRHQNTWQWDVEFPAPAAEVRHVTLDELRLYQSILRANGPQYHVIERFPLVGRAMGCN